MSIKRYSPLFPLFIFLAMVIMAVTAMLSFSAHITPQKCEESGTPVLYIDTEGGKKIKTKEKYVKATYSINYGGKNLSGSCKIRGRGNTTWKTRELYKKPYLLKLDKAASLLGLPEAEKWILMANTADKTSLRNAYAYYLAKNVWKDGLWTPDAKFLALFVNGRYEGLYALTEKIEIRQN
ncbi:MAG: CotH kinase family protein, partial [Treponema sp.]|nr:CotH kinase family protein [Treponema sp.]